MDLLLALAREVKKMAEAGARPPRTRWRVEIGVLRGDSRSLNL